MLVVPAAAHADVAPGGTTGAVQLVAAPPSLAAGAFTSSTAIQVINEQPVTLAVTVSFIGMSANGWTSVQTSAASTCVQSHLVHMNRASTTAGSLAGTVTFNSNVVGVVTDLTGFLSGALALTDPIFGNRPRRPTRRAVAVWSCCPSTR